MRVSNSASSLPIIRRSWRKNVDFHSDFVMISLMMSKFGGLVRGRFLRNFSIGVMLAVAVMSMTLMPADTWAQEATPATGNLVVVPQSLDVGETTLAVGFHVEPGDLEVKIEYGDHFVPEGESCPATSAGATQSSVVPTWIHLTACSAGDVTVKLVASDTGAVIESVSVTITEPSAVTGQQVAASPTVSLSGVASSLKVGQGDHFSVSASGLDEDLAYELHTVPLNNNLAFNRNCTDRRKTANLTNRTSYSTSYTVYGCRSSGSNLWAYLRQGGTAIDSTSISDNRIDVTPTVNLSSSQYSMAEGGSVSVTVRLNGANSESPTIPISITRGTAESTDYTVSGLSSGSLAFSRGDTSKSFTISASQDDDCHNETLTVSLGSLPSSVASGSPTSARVTIRDDDTCTPVTPTTPTVTISASASSITEGQSVTFTVSANPAPASQITVNLSSTLDGNFVGTGPPPDINISSDSETATFTVTTINDEQPESDGSVTVNIERGTGYNRGGTSSRTAEVEIADNDGTGPTVTISASSTSITEGQGVTFTVSADPAPSSLLTVNLSHTLDGSFFSGTPRSSIDIASGSNSASYPVQTTGDTVDEAHGGITAAITANSAYALGDSSSVTVAVNDNDDTTVRFGSLSYTVHEGSSFGVGVAVRLSLAASADLSIPITVTPQTGAFTVSGLPSGNLSISSGSRSASFRITAGQDGNCSDEAISLAIGDNLPSGITKGTQSTATVTIRDNDDNCNPQPPVTPPTPTPPGKPRNVTYTPGRTSGAVSLDWDSATGATGYQVRQCVRRIIIPIGCNYSTVQTLGSSVTEATVTGLATDKLHQFRIRATKGSLSNDSGEVTVNLRPTPQNLIGVPGSRHGQVKLSWDPVSNPDVADDLDGSYHVEQLFPNLNPFDSGWKRLSGTALNGVTIGSITREGDKLTVVVKGLAAPLGAAYKFRIKAESVQGKSAASNVATAGPQGRGADSLH